VAILGSAINLQDPAPYLTYIYSFRIGFYEKRIFPYWILRRKEAPHWRHQPEHRKVDLKVSLQVDGPLRHDDLPAQSQAVLASDIIRLITSPPGQGSFDTRKL
jgi:hypothetical protein